MAIILCPECGEKISDKSSFCPHCGFPITDLIKPKREDEIVYYENVIGKKRCRISSCNCSFDNHIIPTSHITDVKFTTFAFFDRISIIGYAGLVLSQLINFLEYDEDVALIFGLFFLYSSAVLLFLFYLFIYGHHCTIFTSAQKQYVDIHEKMDNLKKIRELYDAEQLCLTEYGKRK